MSFAYNFLLLILLGLFVHSGCLYVNLVQNKQKCFYDNFYNEMIIIMRYNILDEDVKNMTLAVNNNRFEISVYSKEEKKILNVFRSTKLSAKFSQTIEGSGEYKICIKAGDNALFKKRRYLKLEFQIDSSEDGFEDADKAVKMKDFEMVNEKMKKVMRKAETFSQIQDYHVTAEDKFSQNQIKTSRLIATLSIVQIVIICCVGVYHVFSLRKIFKEKIWTPF